MSSISWIEIGSFVDSLRRGASPISSNFVTADLIEIKLHRERLPNWTIPAIKRCGWGRSPAAWRDQKLRRFLFRPTGSCGIGCDWKSPQMITPAKITNTDTTAAETSIESTGIATSFGFPSNMPN
jgi:hypothetical protein